MGGDEHLGIDAAGLGGGGYAESMVAIGGGDDAGGGLLRSKHGDLVRGAAEFEGTGVLEVLEFEMRAKFGGIFDRGFPDIRMDAEMGGKDGGMHEGRHTTKTR